MTDEPRVLRRVAGVMTVVVVAVVGSGVYDIVADDHDPVPLGVADVEGAWIAESGSDARLVVRGDGSAELTREAHVAACGGPPEHDGRTARATWVFGDSDEPRVVHLELRDPDTADPCSCDLHVDDSGGRAAASDPDGSSFSDYVRSNSPG
ncbi:hypothetical protein R1T08_20195 [Streptomyces sp. SBC-4]|nr:hypothetical protein [Streptomyces sp. SBC-4]MDV5146457.1 hypothetical protein [Streptomyces sp. SBC-4]